MMRLIDKLSYVDKHLVYVHRTSFASYPQHAYFLLESLHTMIEIYSPDFKLKITNYAHI